MFNYPINKFVKNIPFPENLAVKEQNENLKRDERFLTFGVRKRNFNEQSESFRQINKFVL